MGIKQQLNHKLIGTVTCSQHFKAVDFYWDSILVLEIFSTQ